MHTMIALTLLAAGTYVLRVACITLLRPDALPSPARAVLDHLGPAALAALVVTVAVGDGGAVLPTGPETCSLITAAAISLRGGTLLQTIGGGLLVLWIGQALAAI